MGNAGLSAIMYNYNYVTKSLVEPNIEGTSNHIKFD